MFKVTPPSPFFGKSRAGFALLITIVLMAFLVLLMVSMASLTRVEIAIATNSQKAEQARANAMMALKIAMGQLQKTVGPDQRTTARADILSTTTSVTDIFEGGEVTGMGGKVYHNNALLTGVWSNATDCTGNTPGGLITAANSGYVNTPALLTWLVSGNESANYTIDYDSASTNQSADGFVSNFGRVISDGSNPITSGNYTASIKYPINANADRLAVQLVGPGTVGGRNANGTITPTPAQQALMVAAITQPLTVPAGSLPGRSAGDTTPVTVGRYAYWVGDEGVKAKFNIPDAWAPDPSIAFTDAETRYRYQVAQRAGIELVSDGLTPPNPLGKTAYDQSTPAGRDNIAKAIAYNSIGLSLMASDTSLAPFAVPILRNRFHDLTTYSKGLLSNTLHGGLKKDLTAAFATGTTITTAPTGKLWSIPLTALGNSACSADTTMVETPTTNTYDGLGPDWQVLRSYAQLALTITGTGSSASMAPIPPSAPSGKTTEPTQMGVHPVIVGYQITTQCKLVQNGSNSYVEVKHMPAVMLWNPYNVTLTPSKLDFEQDYRTVKGEYTPLTYYARIVQVPTTSTASGEANEPSKMLSIVTGNSALLPAYDVISPYFNSTTTTSSNPLKFSVDTGSMAPGTAYIYTMTADEVVSSPTATTTITAPTLQPGWNVSGSVPYGICLQSAKFSVPTATAGNTILANFYCGGQNSAHPAAGAFLAPTGGVGNTATRLIMRSGGVGLQMFQGDGVRGGFQYYFTASQATTRNALNFTRNELKAFINNSLITSATPAEQGRIPWLSAYNPRATNSFPTSWEYQKNHATNYTLTGYYTTSGSTTGASSANPSFWKSFSTGINNSNNSAYTATPGAPESSLTPISISGSTYTIDQIVGPIALFDIPRPNQPLASIAALQHADVYRSTFDNTIQFPLRFGNNAAPAYVIGNSKADQRVKIELPYSFYEGDSAGNSKGNFITNTAAAIGSVKPVYYDHSFLANRALWDGYYFSTVPASGSWTFPLPSGRHVLAGEARANDTADLLDYNKSATRLIVDGAFNINSTSVEAWTAILASTINSPVGTQSHANQAPLPRLQYPLADANVMAATSLAESNANTYLGYRALTGPQITSLATEIVKQVKARGPFVSLADFVNRALVDGTASASTINDLRLGGVLHAALANSTVNGAYTTQLIAPNATTAAKYPVVTDLGDTVGGKAAGDGTSPAQATPGWVTQADLLQVIGPVISARSDTFVIRVYGEVVDPLAAPGTPTQAKAWAEAVVQRFPEYINQNDGLLSDGDATPPTSVGTINQKFGRRLKIISFRWLSPADI